MTLWALPFVVGVALVLLGGVLAARRPRPRKMRNPLGWDEKAQRTRDVTPTPRRLLHHSTCRCRTKPYDGEIDDA